MRKKNIKLALIVLAIAFNAYLGFRYLLPKANLQSQIPYIQETSITEKPVERLYGFAVDSFNVETSVVKRDQNLGNILGNYELPERAMAQLTLYSGNVFDLRKIRNGNQYTAFMSKDSANRLEYLVYEHSPIEYVVFDFTDSVTVSLKQREVITKQRTAHGEIKTSLWDAITKSNVNPAIAIQLSEIYAWTVDFFGLQPGDNFNVVYDEMFVENTSIGIGKIYAATFTHAGKELMAIPFMQDGVESYYDADGNSLRRAFLKAPVRYSRISSRFSASRLHPILKIRRPHFGVDYAAPVGTPVYAIGDGRILSAAYQHGAGRIVKIRHNGVYTSTYMHLSGFAKGITSGKYVAQGDLIGYVGSSGLSTGPHLDFRVYRNGSPIDPLKMESPAVDPVKQINRDAFENIKLAAVDMLNSDDDQPSLAQVNAEGQNVEAGFIPKDLIPENFIPKQILELTK